MKLSMNEPQQVIKREKYKSESGIKPWLFMLPTLLILMFWLVKPLVQTLMYTFCEWNMIPGTSPTYVGLENFIELLEMPDFLNAVKNTFYYIVMLLPFSVVLPLIIAAVTQDLDKRSKQIYRALIFLPMIMPPVAISSVFQWLLHPTNGVVNHLLLSSGITSKPINFFMTEKWARLIVTFIAGWKMVGFSALMFSASIGNINPEYYKAAQMDGASPRKMFFDLTIPLLSPTIMLMIMMSILFASQWTFVYIDMLTNGGPYGTSTNIYYLIYQYAFGNANVGLSAAASLVFLLIFGVVAIALQVISNKLSFYDN